MSDRVLGRGSYGAVYLAMEVATSRQVACKIVDLDAAAHQLTELSVSDIAREDWHEGVRRLTRGKELVMREVKILSKLSHVGLDLRSLSQTNTSQPHIVNFKKAFVSSCAL